MGSSNDLSHVQWQAITWTIADLLSIGPLGTNFSEILVKIQNFPFMKMHFKLLKIICEMAANFVQGEMS